MLLDASCPMIFAGQGIFYAEATEELRRLAELLQAPVMTTFDGKSAFPEDHALALGSGGGTFTGHGRHFLHKSDLVLGDRLQLYPPRHRHPGIAARQEDTSMRPTTRATCTRPLPPISGSSAMPSWRSAN